MNRRDCTPDAPIPVKMKRRYSGPPKGSQEAKDRMSKVRAAQWAKNGLVVSNPPDSNGGYDSRRSAPDQYAANRA